FEGTWYISASSPSLFPENDHIKQDLNNVDEEKKEVSGTQTFNINGTSSEHKIRMISGGANVTVIFSDEDGDFSGVYELIAVDDKFFIDYGKPSADSDGITVIHYSDECPDDETQEKVKEALKKACLDFADFSQDEKIDCNSK
ncbi:hypothetical protein L9F63_012373, partial [Diploptera punctata]